MVKNRSIGMPDLSQDIVHPLKEVDASAMAWTKTTEQVIEILKYITKS